jgi:hypothetical protein
MMDSANVGSTAKEGFSEVKLRIDNVIEMCRCGGALHCHVPGLCLWHHLDATIISKLVQIPVPETIYHADKVLPPQVAID